MKVAKLRSWTHASAALSLISSLHASGALAYPYEFLGFDFPDASATFGYGIGNSGLIVGGINYGPQRGFVREPDGTFLFLDFPDSVSTTALGVNNAGEIVGDTINPPTSSVIGFIRTVEGSYSSFRYPNTIGMQSNDINDDGFIVGAFAVSISGRCPIRC